MVEMMIVMAIAALILVVGVPQYQSFVDRSRVAQARAQVADIAKQIQEFDRKNGRLPASFAELPNAAVITSDPWGSPYRYFILRGNPGAAGARRDRATNPINSDFDLYSIGRDSDTHLNLNRPESRDDIIRARDGAFIGFAQEFDP
jgi:general secretion pathway protein G